MKQTILATLVSLFFVACQNEIPQEAAVGSLEFESVEMAASSNETLSRAIDADLTVEIWKDGAIYQDGKMTYRFTSSNCPKTMTLPTGTYQVKAFNEAYHKDSEWTNSDLGSAIYYKEENIEISDAKATKIAMRVPMTNIGVTFRLPKGFEQSFSEYTFTVTEGAEIANVSGEDAQNESDAQPKAAIRTVSVRQPQTIYLKSGAFTVTLAAKNIDNESVTTSYTHQEVIPGTVYTIAYQVAATREISASLEKTIRR